jgi:prevent-host-death family protein
MVAVETFNIHEAKTHLSRLIDKAVKGEPFIIAKAGKPLVKVTAIDEAPFDTSRRIGFMEGEFTVPDDIKTPFKDEIEEMFYGKP